MRIAFWSEQQNVGTTYNLAVVSCAAALMYPVSVAVVSGGYHGDSLEQSFFGSADGCSVQQSFGWQCGREPLLAAERESFFLSGGLECLLLKERPEDLTELVVKANMRQIMKDRMYCLPSSAKSEQEWWHRDRLFARMGRVLEAVESYFDVVFIDCGNRKDDYAQKVLKEADVCVLNMDQETQHIGEFYQAPPKLRGEIFFLLGNYFENALYSRENLQRVYRMDENRLGAIPYDPQLQAASRMGRIQNGVKRYVERKENGSCGGFSEELARSVTLILKLGKVIE